MMNNNGLPGILLDRPGSSLSCSGRAKIRRLMGRKGGKGHHGLQEGVKKRPGTGTRSDARDKRESGTPMVTPDAAENSADKDQKKA